MHVHTVSLCIRVSPSHGSCWQSGDTVVKPACGESQMKVSFQSLQVGLTCGPTIQTTSIHKQYSEELRVCSHTNTWLEVTKYLTALWY